MATHDTICAIATPPGTGGVGIVRVSGPEAVAIAATIARLRNGRVLADAESHRMYAAAFGRVTADSATRSVPFSSSEWIDTGLVVVMRAPHSYTGEDVVELHAHGSPLVLRQLCALLIEQGAHLAEPGEFSKRAFLNGKLDLAQAEGVLDTIRARTDDSLRQARQLAAGHLSARIRAVQASLTSVVVEVEAGIDFVEEDLSFVGREELLRRLDDAVSTLQPLIDSWERGRLLREGATVAIVGKPNVGKSSLLNALVMDERAIVSSEPGTTRDIVEGDIIIEGIVVRLRDTAGIRDAHDVVEREGVRRSQEALDQADLLLCVVDGSHPLDSEDLAVLRSIGGKPHLVLINKSDRPQGLTAADLGGFKQDQSSGPLAISARDGVGLERVRAAIAQLLTHPPGGDGLRDASSSTVRSDSEGLTVTRLRHHEALVRARDAVVSARTAVGERLSLEFIAADLRIALSALGDVIGGGSTEDVLDAIFSEFCIGK
ncbi:MAG: tRNA uridine-5-carboxymethylaminomethyl(34) synthesis GTPase MnmE [Nitrospiraceae bacterium]